MRKQFVQKMPMVRQRVGPGALWVLEFNNDYVDIQGATEVQSDVITGCAWVKFNENAAGGNHDVVIAIRNPANNQRHALILVHDSSRTIAHWDDTRGWTYSLATPGVNSWVHLIVERTQSNIAYYVNNILTASQGKGTFTYNAWDQVRIGGSPWATQYCRARICDVRLFNRALTAAEHLNVMNGLAVTNGLIGHWPMNEGQNGTISHGGDTYDVKDLSGNNNHGSNVGAVWVKEVGSEVPTAI